MKFTEQQTVENTEWSKKFLSSAAFFVIHKLVSNIIQGTEAKQLKKCHQILTLSKYFFKSDMPKVNPCCCLKSHGEDAEEGFVENCNN